MYNIIHNSACNHPHAHSSTHTHVHIHTYTHVHIHTYAFMYTYTLVCCNLNSVILLDYQSFVIIVQHGDCPSEFGQVRKNVGLVRQQHTHTHTQEREGGRERERESHKLKIKQTFNHKIASSQHLDKIHPPGFSTQQNFFIAS